MYVYACVPECFLVCARSLHPKEAVPKHIKKNKHATLSFFFVLVCYVIFFFKRYNPIVLNLNCKSYFCLFFQLFFVVKCFLIIFSVHITPTIGSFLSHFISSYSRSLLRTSFRPRKHTTCVPFFLFTLHRSPTPNYTYTRHRILTLFRSFAHYRHVCIFLILFANLIKQLSIFKGNTKKLLSVYVNASQLFQPLPFAILLVIRGNNVQDETTLCYISNFVTHSRVSRQN